MGLIIRCLSLRKIIMMKVQILSPLRSEDYTWKGFTAKSLDTPIAMLWTGEYGEGQIQLMICLENGEKISLDDVDVQAIIASINISKG